MAKLQLRKFRVCVWLFALLLLIVPLFVGVGLTLKLGSNDFQDRIISAVSSQLPVSIRQDIDPQPLKTLLKKIQVPLLSAFFFVFASSVLGLILVFRYLITPMDRMTATAYEIIDGNLDISMPVSRCHEVNQLGRAFNDLSINLQEVILLVWNFLRDSSVIMDRVLESEPLQNQEINSTPVRHDLMVMREEMKTIEKVVTSFNLYDVQIIDQRAMAGANTWQQGIDPGRLKVSAEEVDTSQ